MGNMASVPCGKVVILAMFIEFIRMVIPSYSLGEILVDTGEINNKDREENNPGVSDNFYPWAYIRL
jgi:hypothetical protein